MSCMRRLSRAPSLHIKRLQYTHHAHKYLSYAYHDPFTLATHSQPNCIALHYHSQRFKRGAKGRKKTKEEEATQGGRPEKGTTLDTEDYKKRMQKLIVKLQQQLREIQPRTANTSVVEGIEASINGKKTPIKKMADVSMRGVSSIAILPHKPETMADIEAALIKFSEEFNPRCDTKSGLIIVSVPKPNEEQLASLRFAVTTRRDSTKRACQDLMKVAMNEAKRLSEFLPKDDLHEYNVALNELIKEEQAKIDELSEKKLKEFD